MPLDPCFEQALRSSEPVVQLRSLAMRLSSEGRDHGAILDLFEQARRQLREDDRESDEDAVMDVMDDLVGWCGPHMKLSPSPGEHRREPAPPPAATR